MERAVVKLSTPTSSITLLFLDDLPALRISVHSLLRDMAESHANKGPIRLITRKLELLKHLKETYRQLHDADTDILLGANTAVDNPEDRIVSGFEESPDEHSLDPVVKTAAQAYEMGREDGLREGLRRISYPYAYSPDRSDAHELYESGRGHGLREERPMSQCTTVVPESSEEAGSTYDPLDPENSFSMVRGALDSRCVHFDLPPRAPTPQPPTECGENVSTQRLAGTPRKIKAASLSSKAKGYGHRLANMAAKLPVAPLRTISEPTIIIARKPVPRKPVITRAETDAANVLKGSSAKLLAVRDKTIKLLGPLPVKTSSAVEQKGGDERAKSMETFLMLFAMGAAAAWMLCILFGAVLSKH